MERGSNRVGGRAASSCAVQGWALLTSHLQKPAGQHRALPPSLPFTVITLGQQGTESLSDFYLVWATLPKTLVRARDFIVLLSREHFLAGGRAYAHDPFQMCCPYQGPQMSWAVPALSGWAVTGMKGRWGPLQTSLLLTRCNGQAQSRKGHSR